MNLKDTRMLALGTSFLLLCGCSGCQSPLPRLWPGSLTAASAAVEAPQTAAAAQLLAPLPAVDSAVQPATSELAVTNGAIVTNGAFAANTESFPPVAETGSGVSRVLPPVTETAESVTETDPTIIDAAFQRLKQARTAMRSRDPLVQPAAITQ